VLGVTFYYSKTTSPRTLQKAFAWDLLEVLGGGGRFLNGSVPLYVGKTLSRGACRGTALIRKRIPLRPYRRPMPRVLWGS